VVAVLSGLEPHRTLLENEIIARYQDSAEQVLIVQGLMHRPNTRIKRGNLTIVPYMGDNELVLVLLGAKHIIARSGYSTIMDLEALGLMGKAELIPTPGQPEQEYLATLHNKMQ
jgi:predicted glycosyltransferase